INSGHGLSCKTVALVEILTDSLGFDNTRVIPLVFPPQHEAGLVTFDDCLGSVVLATGFSQVDMEYRRG
ncbi:MAG: hypothetical protein LC676_04890, partial [Loktanella sp.]|nr:hypothetical protein [Loktanella sp.]